MGTSADSRDAAVTGDNVVSLPNLMGGRLADLLAAASGPAQKHELGDELEARAAFRSVSVSWPAPKAGSVARRRWWR